MKRCLSVLGIILTALLIAAPASAQIPVPTPTSLPIDAIDLPVSIPTDMSLWDFAPNAIQIWNTANRDNVMTGFQLIVLIMILGGGVMVVGRMYGQTQSWEDKLDSAASED